MTAAKKRHQAFAKKGREVDQHSGMKFALFNFRHKRQGQQGQGGHKYGRALSLLRALATPYG